MDINTLRVLITLLSFIVFIGIVVWVWRHRHTADFEEAARLLQKIRLLESASDIQHVENIRVKSLDAVSLYREGADVMI